MILINKNRFKLLNNIIYKIIQDLYIFYHSFEMNNIVSEIEKGLEFYLDSKNTGNEDNEYDKVKTT